jgi:glycosyltransferase involved in cell wall biosynthesis
MRVLHLNLGGFGGVVDGITAAESELFDLLARAGHEPIRLDSGGERWLSAAVTAAVKARGMRADVVHLHSIFRPAHCVVARLLRGFQIPYVVSPHSALSPEALTRDALRKRLFLDRFDRAMLRSAAVVLCLTAREERDVLAVCPYAQTAVVPNPYVARTSPLWAGSTGARPTVVTLARYDVYQKALDYISSLARALPEADFHVHGARDHNEVELVGAVARNAPRNFSLQPPVVGAAKERALTSASLYVQASRWEGLSISLIEALAVGVPVAVSPQVAETVPVQALQMGLVLSADPWLAAQSARSLIRDPDRQAAMSAAGREWVRRSLAPERVLLLLEEVYRGAIAERS